jgi:hypothetical protein
MAKCEVEVVLESPEPTCRSGETVGGVVIVKLKAAVRCDGLKVACFWRTHGRGNRDEGDRSEQTLFTGEWLGDREYEYPFEFTVPSGPPTYHGHYVNVDWYVGAVADIPWAIDPKGEAEFRLEPPDPVEREPVPWRTGDDRGRELQRAALHFPKGARVLVGCAMFGAFALGGLSMFEVIRIPYVDSPFEIFCLVGTTLAVVGGATLAFVLARNKMAAKKIGDVDLQLGDTHPRPGGTVECALRFAPLEQVDLRPITARLLCVETAVSGSGTNRTTHRKEVVQEEHVLREALAVRPPEMVDVTYEVPVPRCDAFSFDANNNSVKWFLEIAVDVPRWPDWVKRVPLTVSP